VAVVVASSGVERSFVEKGVKKVQGKVGCDCEVRNDEIEDARVAFRIDRIGYLLRLEEVGHGCVCGTKGSDVLSDICEVLRIARAYDAFDSAVNVEASFGDCFCCGYNLGTFELIGKRDDASRRDAIVREVIDVIGQVEFCGEVFRGVFLGEKMLNS
jgi:hypothetical protein